MKLIKELPDPFRTRNGRRVATAADWRSRRCEIRALMLDLQYGALPGAPEEMRVHAESTEQTDDGGRRDSLRLEFVPNKARPDVSFGMDVSVRHPSPEAVELRRRRIGAFGRGGLPVLLYVGSGAFAEPPDRGVMMVCYQNDQLEPMEEGNPIVGPARSAYEELEPGAYSWGSIAVWAWGAMRLLDYVLAIPEANGGQVMVSGHSRNGKAALLAGALDDRFALVNPAGSGCAGAGSYLALGAECEDLAALTDRKRWWAWTRPEFATWAGREEELPFDQHFLMGLVAPRPLLRTEGDEDHWANPAGTCASFLATEPVYEFLGVPERNGIHFHPGGHHQGEEDIEALLDFADWQFFGGEAGRSFKRLPRGSETFPTLFRWKPPAYGTTA